MTKPVVPPVHIQKPTSAYDTKSVPSARYVKYRPTARRTYQWMGQGALAELSGALTLVHLVKEGVHIAKASAQCVQGFPKDERQQWQGSPCSMQC